MTEALPDQPSRDVAGGLEDSLIAHSELSAESAITQPDAVRTCKHLAGLAAPASTCKLLVNQWTADKQGGES